MTVTQFESLLKTHGSAILGFCRHLTGDEISAQDLYQDTLLKAFSNLAKINCDITEEMLSAKNYLIGIAVKLYQNQKRRKMNYETSFKDDVEDMLYIISYIVQLGQDSFCSAAYFLIYSRYTIIETTDRNASRPIETRNCRERGSSR